MLSNRESAVAIPNRSTFPIVVVIQIRKVEIEKDNMADAGDDIVSLGTRIGAGIPPAPRMGSGSMLSSASGAAGTRNALYASVEGARQNRSTQA